MNIMRLRLRRAVPQDSAELIRLRRLLLAGSSAYYASFDLDEQRLWERGFVAWLPEACDSAHTYVAVSEGADALLAACGIAIIDARPPGPGILNGRSGWIQSMVTDPRYRSLGHADAILSLLLDWLRDADVARVTLNTTAEGQRLYHRHGFEHCGEDALVLQMSKRFRLRSPNFKSPYHA